VSVKKNISYTRPFQKNQITYQPDETGVKLAAVTPSYFVLQLLNDMALAK
jgi:hypothetical protein